MTGADSTTWERRTTAPPGRVVTLVLVKPDGSPVGALPPFDVEPPWWQEAESVVRGAREHHGVDVVVLRMLSVDSPGASGGSLTYLAEVTAAVPKAEPWPGDMGEHPLRQTWARPGGPGADLAWAEAAIRERGRGTIDSATQVRTWNLSSLWRLRSGDRTIWLKSVPPFFAHEGPLLERLQDGPVPRLVARADRRSLLDDVAGEDLYDAPLPRLLEMVSVLVDLQNRWADGHAELAAMGLPDWRASRLVDDIAGVIERVAPGLEPADRDALQSFLRALPDRMDAVAAAGIPETLVHGDFHPGNFRGGERSLVLLDWGDSGIGHPLLDAAAFLDRIPPEAVATVQQHWNAEWRAAAPGSDPGRAFELLAPVAAARQALIYQRFLDAIEPSEHPYHADDPAEWLTQTASLTRGER